MSAIERIKNNQSNLIAKLKGQMALNAPMQHKPEMLLIGCVDARLDIIGDLGIPKGKAIVYRNIAALVHGNAESGHQFMSEAAALEFAVKVMGVQDIAVMGHTDCGGIQACLANDHQHEAIHRYLQSLEEVRKQVVEQGGDAAAQARAMEEAAVRQSIQNLLSYKVVADAVSEGKLRLHGWVINTATGLLREMDPKTGKFDDLASEAVIPDSHSQQTAEKISESKHTGKINRSEGNGRTGF